MGELEYNLPEHGEPRSTADGRVRTALSKIKEAVNGHLGAINLEAGAVTEEKIAAGAVSASKLATGVGKITWYTPKVVATEETRENTEYGFWTTEDKIENVVVAENGLLLVVYRAHVKSSVSAAGRYALFLGTNVAKSATGSTSETVTAGTNFNRIWTDPTANSGFESNEGAEADKTTGQIAGGVLPLFVAAGTYTVGIKFKATSGTVTAKERKLWVATLG